MPKSRVDARGWLWEITRDDQAAHVVIEIAGTAWSSDPLGLPAESLYALESDVGDSGLTAGEGARNSSNP